MFRKFSTPGGCAQPLRAARTNSMHEGGELGYSLVHAFGAAFDNPDLIVACVVGDGESETCPLKEAGSRSTSSIRCETVLSCQSFISMDTKSPPNRTGTDERCRLEGSLCRPRLQALLCRSDDPEVVHQLLAQALEDCYAEIRAIQQEARKNGFKKQPVWPMIIFRTPRDGLARRKWMESPSKAHSVRTRFRSHRSRQS